MYESGIRSPEAEIEPRSGITGTKSLLSRATMPSMTDRRTAECPRIKELQRASMAPLTTVRGSAWLFKLATLSDKSPAGRPMSGGVRTAPF